MNTTNSKLIRVGVFGAKRGMSISQSSGKACGLELVAVCDSFEKNALELQEVCGGKENVTIYQDFDKFLEKPAELVPQILALLP